MKYPDLGDLIKVSVSLLGNKPEQLYVVRNWSTAELSGIDYHVEPFVEGVCYQGDVAFVPQHWFDNGWATVVSTEVEQTGENKETESLVGRTIKSTHSSQTFLPLGDYVIEDEGTKEDFTGTYSIYFIRSKENGEEYVVSSRLFGSGLIELVEKVKGEDLSGRIIRVLDRASTGLMEEYYEVMHSEGFGRWAVKEVGNYKGCLGLGIEEEWIEKGFVELLEGDED